MGAEPVETESRKRKFMENGRTVGKSRENDQNVVITARCIDMEYPSPGTVKVPCSECGEMTWLSKSSRKIKFDKIMCESCLSENKEYNDENCFMHVTEECLDDAFDILSIHGIKTTKDEMVKNIEDQLGKKIKIVRTEKKKKKK